MAMKWLSLMFLLSALSGVAQTINAASCNASDVQTAFNAVTSSTTAVNIPAGTCNWTSADSLTIPAGSKVLTIQGSTSISGTCGPGGSCSATDSTVIIDNYASTNPLLSIITNSSCTETRVTGLTFVSGTGQVKQTGMLAIQGTCHNFRFDHNHFNFTSSSLANLAVRYTGWITGVSDHNLFDQTTANTSEAFGVWADTYNGGTYGHGSWADTTQLGTDNFMFLENNTQNNGLYFDDCWVGGRTVVRFNNFNQAQTQTHPTTGAGGDAFRGCRATETYQNAFVGSSACNGGAGFNSCLYNGMFLSSGTGVIWGNNFPIVSGGSNSGWSYILSLQSMRTTNSTYSETPTPNGWGYCGTALGPSNWDHNTNSAGYACMDQPGQGKMDLLTGTFPTVCDSTTGCSTYSGTWPNQALEPVYEWSDTLTPIPDNPTGITVGTSSVLTQNQDYYSWCNASSVTGCTSFNGTVGVGSGVLASRPSTCTTGVAYWATDQGSWNSSGGGGQGVLYKCTATNTWTLFYTPYTYPHPLTGGASAPAGPAAPVSLTVVPH